MERTVQAVTGKNRLEAADDIRKRLFVIFVAVVVAPVNIGFLIGDIVAADLTEIVVDSVLAASLAALIISLARLRRPRMVYRAVLLAVGALMIYWAMDRGEGDSKLYWTFVFAPLAMFVFGKREGLVWALWLMLATALAVAGILPGSSALPRATIVRFLSAYGIIIGISFVFEYARERTYSHLLREHAELQQANERIRKMSITDSLTGTYNRQFLADRLPAEVERARRYGHPLSVIICDIDRFKVVNDTLGHQVGDDVLRNIAQALIGSIRGEVDWIVRYGGEEFLIILPETTIDAAVGVAERLRSAVEQTTIPTSDGKLDCTASFGVAGTSRKPHGRDTREWPTADQLVRSADVCLYEAKRAGRNRVVAETRKSGTSLRNSEIR